MLLRPASSRCVTVDGKRCVVELKAGVVRKCCAMLWGMSARWNNEDDVAGSHLQRNRKVRQGEVDQRMLATSKK